MWCEAVKLPKDPFNLRLLSVQEKGFLDQEYTTARSIWDVRNVLLRVTDATHSLISFQRSKKLFICWVKSPTNSLRNLWEQHKDVNSQSLLMGSLSLLWHVQCASVTPPHLHFNLFDQNCFVAFPLFLSEGAHRNDTSCCPWCSRPRGASVLISANLMAEERLQ